MTETIQLEINLGPDADKPNDNYERILDSVRQQLTEYPISSKQLTPDVLMVYANRIAMARNDFIVQLPPELQKYATEILGGVTLGEIEYVQAGRNADRGKLMTKYVSRALDFINKNSPSIYAGKFADLNYPLNERPLFWPDEAEKLRTLVKEITED